MTTPDVFVVGSSRAGTSTLRSYFAEHPHTFVPQLLEPRYYAIDAHTALAGPGDAAMVATMVRSRAEYEKLYLPATAEQRRVEVTPAYLTSSTAAQAISADHPDAKIVVILRHPVERAVSSFRLECLDGTEPQSDFGRALALEATRKRDGWSYVWRYRERGLYAGQLARYYDAFPADQILVLLHEDWKRDDGRFLLSRVFRFIGVAPIRPSGPTRVVNSADAARFRAVGRTPPTVDSGTVQQLMRSYCDDIDLLERAIGRDLDVWRRWPGAALRFW